MNRVITGLAPRYGRLVDVHRHFLKGDASWFTQTIEPSLRGASEVRAVFSSGGDLGAERASEMRCKIEELPNSNLANLG